MVKPTNERPSAGRNDSQYKGVRKRKWGKWVSEIRLPNSRERIWLGSYDSPEKAARAFDAALFCLRGRNAKFNFPENPPQISGADSLTPPEIRVAAARFANEEMGKEDSGRLASELQLESPSPSSVSDGVAPADSDLTIDWSLLELLTPMVSDDGVSNFVDFPDFHDFPGPHFSPPPSPTFDYEDQNCNDGFSQQSFLWNF